MNQSVRPFRPAALTFSMHKQSAISRKEGGFSGAFIRVLGRSFLFVCFVFFLLSQFFSWRIIQEREAHERLLIVYESLRGKEADLLVQRDKLMAKPRMTARAATQLDLHLPAKGQEHRLY